jgi:hypothetical protein
MAADDCLHVAGEGLSRDQVMKSGNLSLLKHAEEGKALHVLTKVEKGRFAWAVVGKWRSRKTGVVPLLSTQDA